jgi:hypothetical protein
MLCIAEIVVDDDFDIIQFGYEKIKRGYVKPYHKVGRFHAIIKEKQYRKTMATEIVLQLHFDKGKQHSIRGNENFQRLEKEIAKLGIKKKKVRWLNYNNLDN